jgi:L-amino acid N-acyltransferase YncA
MVIRPARADDFAALAAITNHYILATAIHFAYDPITVDELRRLWEHAQERHPWLVAETSSPGNDTSGEIVGYAKSGPWRERAAYAWTAEVGLYLAVDARGRGIGTALYSELLAELALRGFRSAVAGITLPNDPSLALHRKLGFEHVGTFTDAGFKHGAWHAVDFWQKRLATRDDAPQGTPPAHGG